MSLRQLRSEIWRTEGAGKLHRFTARIVPNRYGNNPAVIAHARLVVTGGDSHRLHEQVITAGGLIRQGRFRRMKVGQTETALRTALDKPVSAATQERLKALWSSLRPSLEQALEARMKDRTAGMERQLREREAKESANMEAVLTELAAAIKKELAEPEYHQLELWSMAERSQLNRSIQALQARLDQIPGEIEAEKAAIRARFADPQPRLFPVAITFLVPERLDR